MIALSDVKGVGAATLRKLEELGVTTPAQLVLFLPSKYVDLHSPVRAADAECGQFNIFEGIVVGKTTPGKRGTRSFTVRLLDCRDAKGGGFKVTFFNQPYYHSSFKEGERYLFLGKTQEGEAALVNPVFEPADKVRNLDGVFTVYPLRGAVGQSTFKKLVRETLSALTADGSLPCEVSEALELAHFPHRAEDAERGISRLAAYDTMTAVAIYKRIAGRGDKRRKVFYNLPKDIILRFVSSLTLTPTPSQMHTFEEIYADLSSDTAMSRIVSGDVGSGKTLTAFFAAVCAASGDSQCAVMAPTEILAAQHASKFAPLADKLGIDYALLTASTPRPQAQSTLAGIASGRIKVVFGTQSLLSERVKFSSLSLAVIDEQHKFGVNERAELQNKGAEDVLTLTATPIPRSLALTFYDDIAVSRVEKRADALSHISTKVVSSAKLADMLGFIASECRAGKQAFIVCPCIRDSEGFETLSVNGFEKEYGGIFADVPHATLHGRLSGEEKERIMSEFSAGKLSLLVATSVVEVGVDTKASIMCVLAADRFGLASLHQLRGRVGRDGSEAYCFLHASSTRERALARLKAVVECVSGEEVAERDFEMRGAGDILGTVQSGSTLTPALGLPLTPAVLHAAREAGEEERSRITACFEGVFAPAIYREFAEKVVRVTLDS